MTLTMELVKRIFGAVPKRLGPWGTLGGRIPLVEPLPSALRSLLDQQQTSTEGWRNK